jgi:hypothetical protein
MSRKRRAREYLKAQKDAKKIMDVLKGYQQQVQQAVGVYERPTLQ